MNVVPTPATKKLAAVMIREAQRESGADAVLALLDDVWPAQIPALLGVILDVAATPSIEPPPCPRGIIGNRDAQIIATTAYMLGLDADTLLSPSRHKAHVDARHVACYLLHQDGRTYPAIGRTIGKHHTTILHSVRRVLRDDRLLTIAAAVRAQLEGSEAAA